jgi:hypothetical protein
MMTLTRELPATSHREVAENLTPGSHLGSIFLIMRLSDVFLSHYK